MTRVVASLGVQCHRQRQRVDENTRMLAPVMDVATVPEHGVPSHGPPPLSFMSHTFTCYFVRL